MPTSRRKEVINYYVNKLRTLAATSGIIVTEEGEQLLTEDGLFVLFTEQAKNNKDIYNNVFRGIKYLDQINDFPCIYLQAGQEVFNYDSKGSTSASMTIMLRVYTYEENAMHTLEEFVEDISNKIDRTDYTDRNRIIESTVTSIDTDNGLLDPYGLAEIRLDVIYDVED